MKQHSILLWRDRQDLTTSIHPAQGDTFEEAGRKAVEVAKEDAADQGLDWTKYGYLYMKDNSK